MKVEAMSASAVPGFDDGAAFRSLFVACPDALLLVDLRGEIRLAISSELLDAPPHRELLRKPFTRAELRQAMARARALHGGE
jgi:hypothetical protein